MESKINKIAILVDGDNAQAKLLKPILEEVSKYGKATIRRIYGDWTTPQMNSWKDKLNDLSFSPIQKFAYTTGKNSTDSSMIIDAMDILHDKMVDGFCIVSSDSDYTGLAKRIREDGVFVMGIGVATTPNAFVQSCEVFTYCENIVEEGTVPEQTTRTPRVKKTTMFPKAKKVIKELEEEKVPRTKKYPSVNMSLINRAYDLSINEEEATLIANIGGNLRKIDPSFDSRTYGFKNLTQLFSKLKEYELIKHEVGGVNHPLVKRK
ncbi:MAG TPA: NYN domain-containing protein [Prolixibacteraceae bacterium]|nr:NYN domain-containing protein [Prolixibacteraceae bacterium]